MQTPRVELDVRRNRFICLSVCRRDERRVFGALSEWNRTDGCGREEIEMEMAPSCGLGCEDLCFGEKRKGRKG